MSKYIDLSDVLRDCRIVSSAPTRIDLGDRDNLLSEEVLHQDVQTEVSEAIKGRIKFEVVKDVYEEWLNRGLDVSLWEVLDSMIVDKAPVVHTWVTHVHKEKGLFLDLIGESNGVPDEVRRPLAMSADLLWTLSLIVDDIEDVDVVRGGMEVAWQKYGKQGAMDSATDCLQCLLKYLAVKTRDRQIVYDGLRYVQMGIDSLQEHKQMVIKTPIGELVKNYERRCDFHATYQLVTMARLTGKEDAMQTAAVGLRHINQAGQLINDLKDFVGGDLYARGFSDISKGVSTVPIEYMFDGLQGPDKAKFESLYGHTLNGEDRIFLISAVKASGVIERTKHRIEDYYKEGLSRVAKVVTPDNYSWFERWHSYKMDSLNKSMETHE